MPSGDAARYGNSSSIKSPQFLALTLDRGQEPFKKEEEAYVFSRQLNVQIFRRLRTTPYGCRMWYGERDSKYEEMIYMMIYMNIRRIYEKIYSAPGLMKWIFLCFCLSRCAYECYILEEPRIYFLNADDNIQNSIPGLQIYCHDSSNTITMHLHISSDSYIVYDGQTPDKIYQKYKENGRLSSLNTENNLSDKRKQFYPFSNVCIGVYVDSPSESGYIITLKETYIVWRWAMMAMGIILICLSNILSQIKVFYDICDIIFGKLAIISTCIAKKLIRREHTKWVIFTASMILFFSLLIIGCILWEFVQLKEWLMILFLFLINCIIDDSFGPVANAKTRQNMQWFFMLVGLVLVFCSSYCDGDVAFILCCVMLILYYFPQAAFQRGNRRYSTMAHSLCYSGRSKLSISEGFFPNRFSSF